MERTNYNRTAVYYDVLSRLVFGKAIMQAQTCLLSYIQTNDTVLIAGGGSGGILEAIDKRKPAKVVFAEASAKMLRRAQQRKLQHIAVEFKLGRVEAMHFEEPFNIILTPFLFDNFSDPSAATLFSALHQQLQKDGHWLFVDFDVSSPPRLWKKILLRSMYAFFRLTAGVTNNRLPDTEMLFRQYQYTLLLRQWHYHQLIRSDVWQNAAERLMSGKT